MTRKREKKSISEEKKFAESLIASMKDGFSVIDKKGIHINVNDALCKMTGFAREELIGTAPPHLYWPEEEYENIQTAFKKTLKGEFEDFELIFKRKNGERFPVIVSPSWVKNEKGNIISYFATVKDITELKQTHEEVAEARDYVGNIIKSMIDTLIVVDPKGRIKTVNQATLDVLGYKEKELMGKSIGTILEEEEEEEELLKSTRLKRLIKEGSVRDYEITYRTKSGKKIPMSFSGSVMRKIDCPHKGPIPDCPSFKKKGVHCSKLLGIVGIARDLRQRKKAEEKIRIFSNAVENAYDGFVLADMEGNILYANESANKVFGYNSREMMKLNMVQFTTNPEDAERVLAEIKKKGGWSGELIQVRKNKEEFPAILSISLIKDEKGEFLGMMGVFRDITERKQMEGELHIAERMAGIGQVAAGVAHEFNNLLNIIGGSAEYAQGIRDEVEISEALDIIMKSSERGAGIVKNLLAFAGRVEPKMQSADIVGAVEEVLNLVKRDLEKNNIRIARNYSDVPRTLIDIGQIQQVFLNLILNAQKAMYRGGKLTINLEREEGFIKIEFHNTGRHIRKKDLPRLFTPFFKLEGMKEVEPIGTGLGLSISHGILQAHNGSIDVESERGKGTRFTIRLPIIKEKVSAPVLAKKLTEKVKKGKIKLKQANILVVDDEESICNLFKKVLERKGHTVSIATDGRTAAKLCKDSYFDLIYLDIVMPGMGGEETFRRIQKVRPDTKIVLMTGRLIEDRVAQMLIDKGAIGFIRKPIPNRELVGYTKAILTRKK